MLVFILETDYFFLEPFIQGGIYGAVAEKNVGQPDIFLDLVSRSDNYLQEIRSFESTSHLRTKKTALLAWPYTVASIGN